MDYYSTSKASKILGISNSAIIRSIDKYKIKVKRIGKRKDRRLSAEAIRKLSELLNKPLADSFKSTLEGLGSDDNLKGNSYINSLVNQITDLKKDKENLTRLLENQQILTKQAQDKILLLASPEIPKKKESLLHRILNKKIF